MKLITKIACEEKQRLGYMYTGMVLRETLDECLNFNVEEWVYLVTGKIRPTTSNHSAKVAFSILDEEELALIKLSFPGE